MSLTDFSGFSGVGEDSVSVGAAVPEDSPSGSFCPQANSDSIAATRISNNPILTPYFHVF